MVNPGNSGSPATNASTNGAWGRGAGGPRFDGERTSHVNAMFGGGSTSNNGDAVSWILELHHSVFPGQILVTKPLTESNYNSWTRAMKLALRAKKKLRFVEGAVPKPGEDDLNFEQWTNVDAMVTSWLLNSISTEVA